MTRRWLPFAGAVVSGVLLACARPPLDLGPLAFVALVPLLAAWREATARRAAALGFVAGAAYFGLLVSWAWYFGAVALVPFVAVLAGSWAAAGAVVGALGSRGVRSPVLTAAAWVVAEAVLARVPLGGFSWGEVGYALHDLPLARGLASVGGVPLVSFVVVAASDVIASLARRRTRTDLVRAVAVVAAGVVVVSVVVAVRPTPAPAGELRVAILQGNDKNRDLTEAEVDARYLPNSHFALEREAGPADLVIFPESSMDEDPRTDPELGERLAAVARDREAWVLANAVADGPDRDTVWNLDVLYGPDGEVVGTYAKRHLVPFGEYVPWSWVRSVVPALDREIPRDHLPGSGPGHFTVAGTRIATVICFESAFAHEVRPLVADGAEVIVLSTNNRSYRRSANSEQHLALGRMRAAETGRPLVQAAISGISAFVDADGDVVSRTALFDRTVLEHTVVATRGETWYVRFGEWVVWASVVALAAGVGLAARRSRRASLESARDVSSTGGRA